MAELAARVRTDPLSRTMPPLEPRYPAGTPQHAAAATLLRAIYDATRGAALEIGPLRALLGGPGAGTPAGASLAVLRPDGLPGAPGALLARWLDAHRFDPYGGLRCEPKPALRGPMRYSVVPFGPADEGERTALLAAELVNTMGRALGTDRTWSIAGLAAIPNAGTIWPAVDMLLPRPEGGTRIAALAAWVAANVGVPHGRYVIRAVRRDPAHDPGPQYRLEPRPFGA